MTSTSQGEDYKPGCRDDTCGIKWTLNCMLCWHGLMRFVTAYADGCLKCIPRAEEPMMADALKIVWLCCYCSLSCRPPLCLLFIESLHFCCLAFIFVWLVSSLPIQLPQDVSSSVESCCFQSLDAYGCSYAYWSLSFVFIGGADKGSRPRITNLRPGSIAHR